MPRNHLGLFILKRAPAWACAGRLPWVWCAWILRGQPPDRISPVAFTSAWGPIYERKGHASVLDYHRLPVHAYSVCSWRRLAAGVFGSRFSLAGGSISQPAAGRMGFHFVFRKGGGT